MPGVMMKNKILNQEKFRARSWRKKGGTHMCTLAHVPSTKYLECEGRGEGEFNKIVILCTTLVSLLVIEYSNTSISSQHITV